MFYSWSEGQTLTGRKKLKNLRRRIGYEKRMEELTNKNSPGAVFCRNTRWPLRKFEVRVVQTRRERTGLRNWKSLVLGIWSTRSRAGLQILRRNAAYAGAQTPRPPARQQAETVPKVHRRGFTVVDYCPFFDFPLSLLISGNFSLLIVEVSLTL